MKKIWMLILLASVVITSCIKVAQEPSTDAPPLFVTSTLPPTRPGLSLPTETPSTATLDPSTTNTPGTPGATESTGTSAACKDSAVMIRGCDCAR